MSTTPARHPFGPPPPSPDGRAFLESLMEPLHGRPIRWERGRPRPGEISLAAGVSVDRRFPDPDGSLETACEDFGRFLDAARIPRRGPCPLRLLKTRAAGPESFRIDPRADGIDILAGDADGVRRALVYLEDELLRSGGPFLAPSPIERTSVIRRRIAFHVSMFERLGHAWLPDEFLNRLAHDGVNGLMLPMERLYPHRIVPAFTKPPHALFAALREAVRRYARYGIKLYLYLNEPKSFPAGDPLRRRYPHLLGGDAHGLTFYCTSTKAGRDALSEGFRRLVAGAPGLGGLIVICVGERPTHCYSASYEPRVRPTRCPRCSRRAPVAVLRDTLAAMARGVHAADPRAEFIAWPYSQYMCWGERLTRETAARIPPGVVYMHNVDSNARVVQLGKVRLATDYWLSVPGPSALFRDCARAARRRGTPVYAKTVTGCSHELASVPYVPVPGLVCRRFRALHDLGVSGAMLNWGSGNDPSLMNRAAGVLAFAPLPADERAFLEWHARRDWGRHAPTVARAWALFGAAYEQIPAAIGFSYFGPLHNGPAWPLYLEPRRLHLGGNWRPDPPGGDVIGDCTGYHSLDEVLALATRLRDRWRKGLRLMESLAPAAGADPERRLQIDLARALQCQFDSGVNILAFYDLRERLAWGRGGHPQALLAAMRTLVRRELAVDRRLLPLAERQPRLGFCQEAGAFKYHPALIRWRMRALRTLLDTEFPRVAARLKRGEPPFPEYTGAAPRGCVYRCRRLDRRPLHDGRPQGRAWDALPEALPLCVPAGRADTGRATTWKAGYDRQALYVGIRCREPHMDRVRANTRDPIDLGPDDQVHLVIETSPFAERRAFMANAAGSREYYAGRAMNDVNPRDGADRLGALDAPRNFRWTARAWRGPEGWSLTLRIPFAALGLRPGHRRPLRFSLARVADGLGTPETQTLLPPPADPALDRLGWLVFE